MKAKIIVAVCVALALSASAFAKRTQKDDFKVEYDDITDITTITHVDMESPFQGFQVFPDCNLKNTLAQHENIRLAIAEKVLTMIADYEFSSWLFIEYVVFLDGNGGRLEVNNGSRNDRIITSQTVRESYMAILDGETAGKLSDILKTEKPTVTFVGKNGRTDKLVIKPRVKAAMIATIEKWRTLKEK